MSEHLWINICADKSVLERDSRLELRSVSAKRWQASIILPHLGVSQWRDQPIIRDHSRALVHGSSSSVFQRIGNSTTRSEIFLWPAAPSFVLGVNLQRKLSSVFHLALFLDLHLCYSPRLPLVSLFQFIHFSQKSLIWKKNLNSRLFIWKIDSDIN